ncbi:transporter substrate-binding domain-containing protein [Algibacillus agarilyticus]|uniref:transporter substrate-binding domain-containing protein n=1 Tax=Algibacillus agarilyticus TaxID=2234133 RepID=UPI000DD01B58|nr:transporter substrate-binding domain-containing protein [Algibacillus agarilyticus]
MKHYPYKARLVKNPIWLFIVIACFIFKLPAAYALDIAVPRPGNPETNHKIAILKLMAKHAKNHKIEIIQTKAGNRRHQISLMQAGDLDLIWAPKSKALEAQLRPIKIPLYQGLLGTTALIIKRSDLRKFDSITGIHQLTELKAGLQRASVTRQLLEQHSFKVVSTLRGHLGYMLDGSRFDYYPIAASSAQKTTDNWIKKDKLDLIVHPDILIQLPLNAYFYVNKNNVQLANIIEQALQSAITSGEFETLVKNSKDYQAAKVFLNNKNNKTFTVAGNL